MWGTREQLSSSHAGVQGSLQRSDSPTERQLFLFLVLQSFLVTSWQHHGDHHGGEAFWQVEL